jgi:hypothetical protein
LNACAPLGTNRAWFGGLSFHPFLGKRLYAAWHEHLSTMGELLKPQGLPLFYGGYGYFDNMNAYYAANNYRVIDRTDIPKSEVVETCGAWQTSICLTK